RADDAIQPGDQFAAQIEFRFPDETVDAYETVLQLLDPHTPLAGQRVPAHFAGLVLCRKTFKDFVGAHYTVQGLYKISGWKLVHGRDGAYSLQRTPSPTDRPH
ncbi:MAG: hypothetical protein KDA49_10630, partial [Rhodospirillaceae bacterium]|nr:hypothetical protein [Rhodospirillaceae bacterium]